ncbi:hypothetical protein COU61_04490 [Candidatus Pacearchaeota archaeon CG10_big_fil_rev_8_21_14_0_10_35_13]|nr:MAG: hypothetical protein COU61_04490 [Candidatus Pacearchaeota archaeon CG10_big_fil_rev_8_21_14_0_10_35_13]
MSQVDSLNAKNEVSELLDKSLTSASINSLDPVFRIIRDEVVSPRGQLLILKSGIFDPVLFQASLCGIADIFSPSGVEYSKIIRKSRKALVEDGIEPPSELIKEFVKKVREYTHND